MNLSVNIGAVRQADAITVAPPGILNTDETPDQQATKALAHATIHLVVAGAPAAGRGLFITGAPTSVAADSTAVN